MAKRLVALVLCCLLGVSLAGKVKNKDSLESSEEEKDSSGGSYGSPCELSRQTVTQVGQCHLSSPVQQTVCSGTCDDSSCCCKATSTKEVTTWMQCPAQSDTTILVQTDLHVEFGFDQFWIDTVNHNSLVFNVEACESAILGLFPVFDDSATEERYEIIIGDHMNEVCTIKRVGSIMAQESTPDVLSCDEMRPFWISWQDGQIRLGTGSVVGSDELLVYYDPDPLVVTAVSITTIDDVTGRWEFSNLNAPNIARQTSTEYTYLQMWLGDPSRYNLTFSVQACRDAHIGLFTSLGDPVSDVYEILIGGWENTQSAIRASLMGPIEVWAETPDILSCAEMRPFWISWFEGLIQMGTGTVVGSDIVMQYHADEPDPKEVTAVSVTTFGGSSGNWHFTNVDASTVPFTYTMAEGCGCD